MTSAYYLRLQVKDNPGVLARITGVLGQHGISIESIVQEKGSKGQDGVPVIILTGSVMEAEMNRALAEIEALDSVYEPAVKVRVENLA